MQHWPRSGLGTRSLVRSGRNRSPRRWVADPVRSPCRQQQQQRRQGEQIAKIGGENWEQGGQAVEGREQSAKISSGGAMVGNQTRRGESIVSRGV